ncbi:D-aminoacylase [Pseudoduganella sp. SL102]|uniref:N-acyl-D-amino-acid deacylase family protein n=1 Tax=Pseudoduganella sp. SL102 TaxID=2995154 RepID=UPI00248AAECC|nr:D-aminoacylase [Pseudoduganella sp. SL102]WBR99797.1 D-aminoacylase [Pseudoduganella sp. SL102]
MTPPAQRPPGAILLRGGTVIDGTGSPRYRADVLVEHGRIQAVGPGLAGSRGADVTVFDAGGKVIAPGFIDVHTHDDHIVLTAPAMLPKISQGICTVIVGNCGISLAPLVRAGTDHALPAPLTLLGDAGGFRFDSLDAYANAVNAARPAVNVAALVGHTTLRVDNVADLARAALPAELDAMCDVLDRAMRDGAIGLSSGVFYGPAAAADMGELTALARIAARHGGVYATHLRDEFEAILASMEEATEVARGAGISLVLSHHKCAGPANWGRTRETLAYVECAGKHQSIGLDAYPYVAGSTVLRADLVDDVIDILVTWSDTHPQLAGRYLADIAAGWNCTQREACERLQPGGACYFQMDEADVQRVLRHPATMIGSDGLPHDRHPHPRLWGTFPRVLGHYSRELKLFGLETAVHKMTGMSAARFGLDRRGRIEAGFHADLVVLDPEQVGDRATFEAPIQASAGIELVFVNGVLSYRAGECLPARAGHFLPRGRTPRTPVNTPP